MTLFEPEQVTQSLWEKFHVTADTEVNDGQRDSWIRERNFTLKRCNDETECNILSLNDNKPYSISS